MDMILPSRILFVEALETRRLLSANLPNDVDPNSLLEMTAQFQDLATDHSASLESTAQNTPQSGYPIFAPRQETWFFRANRQEHDSVWLPPENPMDIATSTKSIRTSPILFEALASSQAISNPSLLRQRTSPDGSSRTSAHLHFADLNFASCLFFCNEFLPANNDQDTTRGEPTIEIPIDTDALAQPDAPNYNPRLQISVGQSTSTAGNVLSAGLEDPEFSSLALPLIDRAFDRTPNTFSIPVHVPSSETANESKYPPISQGNQQPILDLLLVSKNETTTLLSISNHESDSSEPFETCIEDLHDLHFWSHEVFHEHRATNPETENFESASTARHPSHRNSMKHQHNKIENRETCVIDLMCSLTDVELVAIAHEQHSGDAKAEAIPVDTRTELETKAKRPFGFEATLGRTQTLNRIVVDHDQTFQHDESAGTVDLADDSESYRGDPSSASIPLLVVFPWRRRQKKSADESAGSDPWPKPQPPNPRT